MRFLFFVILIFAVFVVQAECGRKKGQSKPKKPKAPVTCPDTCKLKRRIGKLESLFTERINNLVTELQSRNASTSSVTLDANDTARLSRFLEGLRSDIQERLQADADEAIGELKTMLIEEQAAISAISTQVEEMIQSIPAAVSRIAASSATQQESSPFTQDVIRGLNETIATMKKQNSALKKRTQAANEMANVIREQNIILGTQSTELRLQNQASQRTQEQLRQRVIDLERRMSRLNASTTAAEESRDRQAPDSRQLGAIRESLSSVQGSSNAALERIRRLEEWAVALIETGDFPNLLPTSHPQPDTPPSDCQGLYQMGFRVSGVYSIRPSLAPESFEVFCEQEYYGGGWTVIQRRRDGSVDFDRNWDDYVSGFGELTSEFWLGNDKIHYLTDQNTYRLHIAMMDWEDGRAYAEYEGFRISNSRDYYSMRIGAYDGTAGDGMRGTDDNGSRNLYLARFTTRDFDNDQCSPCLFQGQAFNNCAEIQRGGWWYRACADANLNGRYYTREEMDACPNQICQGIRWRTWHDEDNYSLRATMMLVRAIGAGDS